MSPKMKLTKTSLPHSIFVLIFFVPSPIFGCNRLNTPISKLLNEGLLNIKPGQDTREFRRTVNVADPLYYGQSTKELLSLCAKAVQPKEEDMFIAIKRDQLSDCDHQPDPLHPDSTNSNRKMSNVELFLLKEAQKKFKEQQASVNNKLTAVMYMIMFLIPLCMAIYLVIVGHFYLGDLPVLSNFYKPKPDMTEGVKYNLFSWMKFRILPGNHPDLKESKVKKLATKTRTTPKSKIKDNDAHDKRSSDKSNTSTTTQWCKYNKDDELVDPRKISITSDSTKFRFRERLNMAKFIDDDTSDKTKGKPTTKIGWDFVTDPRNLIQRDKDKARISQMQRNSLVNRLD